MATIRKRGDRYQVQVRRKGLPPLSKSFRLLADAKEWANLQERQADRGELGPGRKSLDRITLAELIQRYLDEVVPRKRHGETDRFALGMILRHRMAKKRLADISASDFNNYRDERLKVVSPATLKRQLSPIKHMFRHARDEWELPLSDNPLSRLKFAGADKQRERRLMDGELARLELAARLTRNKLVLPVVHFALETAMRRGEILSLQPRDIDLERMTATVRQSKNGHSRTIPLTEAAAQILRKRPKLANATLFPLTPLALRLAWDRLTRRASLSDLHFHDLRHEAISRFFELGLTVPEVASISGHREVRMLLRYAHADPQAIKQKLANARK